MIMNTFSNCYLKQRENPIYQIHPESPLKRSNSMFMANNITDSIKNISTRSSLYTMKRASRENMQHHIHVDKRKKITEMKEAKNKSGSLEKHRAHLTRNPSHLKIKPDPYEEEKAALGKQNSCTKQNRLA